VAGEVLEAGEVDGAGLITSIPKMVPSVVSAGRAATALTLPVLIAGRPIHHKPVRGLSRGAVK